MLKLFLSLVFLFGFQYQLEVSQIQGDSPTAAPWISKTHTWNDKHSGITPNESYAFINTTGFADTRHMKLLPWRYYINWKVAEYESDVYDFFVDPGRKYKILNAEIVATGTHQQWHDTWGYLYLEDDKYYYFYHFSGFDFSAWSNLGFRKSDIPNMKVIGSPWEQYYFNIALYSDGYLVLPPYKFPVDSQTFSFIPRDESYKVLTWEEEERFIRKKGREFYRNWGRQYTNYLGSDKDRVYRRGYSKDWYALIRERKNADFRLLSFPEIKTYVSSGEPRDIKAYTGTIDEKNRKLIGRDPFDQPNLYYHDNKMYFLHYYWNAVFPIDWASMKYKVVPYTTEDWSKRYYTLLSDKDYYYQLINHYDGSYYTLNRIKK